MADSGKAFDFKSFKRLLNYTNSYRLVFYFVAFAAILLSGLGILRPLLLQITIDESIVPKDGENLVFYISLMVTVLILEAIFMFSFIFFRELVGAECD
jgi:hypothetical protein